MNNQISEEKIKQLFVTFANYHGVNILSMPNCKQPTGMLELRKDVYKCVQLILVGQNKHVPASPVVSLQEYFDYNIASHVV